MHQPSERRSSAPASHPGSHCFGLPGASATRLAPHGSGTEAGWPRATWLVMLLFPRPSCRSWRCVGPVTYDQHASATALSKINYFFSYRLCLFLLNLLFYHISSKAVAVKQPSNILPYVFVSWPFGATVFISYFHGDPMAPKFSLWGSPLFLYEEKLVRHYVGTFRKGTVSCICHSDIQSLHQKHFLLLQKHMWFYPINFCVLSAFTVTQPKGSA